MLSIKGLIRELRFVTEGRRPLPVGTTRSRKDGTYVRTSKGWEKVRSSASKHAAKHDHDLAIDAQLADLKARGKPRPDSEYAFTIDAQLADLANRRR